ncbi:hypothetical protein [Nitrobacter sp.]|uniref:hypothetical protein n=1 Tax=Nitrobacter sp. TaxID=29420 RepID=UPI003F64E7E4
MLTQNKSDESDSSQLNQTLAAMLSDKFIAAALRNPVNEAIASELSRIRTARRVGRQRR